MSGFSKALEDLKAGKRVTRKGWNGKDMFLFLVPGSHFTVNRPPLLGIYPEGTEIDYHAHIDIRAADGQIVPWLASQADLLADDWVGFVETDEEVAAKYQQSLEEAEETNNQSGDDQ